MGSEIAGKTMIEMLTDDEARFANLWTMTVAKYVVLGIVNDHETTLAMCDWIALVNLYGIGFGVAD